MKKTVKKDEDKLTERVAISPYNKKRLKDIRDMIIKHNPHEKHRHHSANELIGRSFDFFLREDL